MIHWLIIRLRNMKITLALLFALTCSLATAQVQRTISVDFGIHPENWSWATDYSDASLQRTRSGGYLRGRVTNNSNFWSLAYRRIDGRFPWTASTTCIIDSSITNEGLALMVVSNNEHTFFKIAGGYRSQWVGSYNSSTQAWTNTTVGDSRGLGDKVCAAIRPNGVPNTITVSAKSGILTFAINDSVVETWATQTAFPHLTSTIDAVGIAFSGNVTGRFDSFTATYTERVMPIFPDAFKGVERTFMTQFEGTGSRYPVIAPNGAQIFFIKTIQGFSDDIFVADALTDSTWQNPRPIGPPINNTEPNNVISVSQDGNELLLWTLYKPDGSGNGGGFSTTRRSGSGWSVPTEVRQQHQVSKSSTREECLSADRSVMIASRQIEGATNGDKDLYVSFRLPDGSYGPFTNLGTAVNTAGEEMGPFLAADGRTLYFGSSDATYGSNDVFVSKRLDDTWLRWSARMNLGPSVNTPFWDGYFTIHPSGKYAYMNSDNGERSGIFRLKLPQDNATRSLLPDPIVVVKGRTLDARTKKPLGVPIRYEDLRTNTSIGKALSDSVTGKYSIVLTSGTNYGFFAEHAGYFPVSDNISLLSLASYQEVERDLYLEPIAVGSVIRLNNLFFETDKTDLRPESKSELDRLVVLLQNSPGMNVSIEGHTDDRGSASHNDALSRGRADVVRAYLVQNGVPESRLVAKGFGKTQPLVQGISDGARTKNRRVEFRITSL